MTKLTLVAALMAATLAVGCATSGSNYRPLVDTRGGDPRQYENDLAQCQQYARQRADAAQGAMVGAIFGAVLMSALGGSARDRQNGAILGGLGAAGSASNTQKDIIRRCLAGRGHYVLN